MISRITKIFPSIIAGLIGAMFMVSCSSTSQAQSGAGIPVIILGEDSDKRSIPRDSDIFRRVINQLKSQMSRYNFYIIDEEMLAMNRNALNYEYLSGAVGGSIKELNLAIRGRV